MKLHDQIRVAASPEAIWPYLANPELIPLWNPKLVAVEHRGHGEVVTGERFTAWYRLGSDREGVRCEVLVRHADPLSAVGYEHTIDHNRRRLRVTEAYRLEALGEATRVSQTVDLSEALPWWIKPLVWLISRTGKPVGRTAMENLARAVESRA